MTIRLRHYTGHKGFTEDFFKVRDFLIRVHEPGYTDGNWLWSRWEYMFSHPALNEDHLSNIGVWENDGAIVGLANYEDDLGDAYFSLDRRYQSLKPEILEYAKEHLSALKEDGTRSLRVMLNDSDNEWNDIAKGHGFARTEKGDTTSEFIVPDRFPDTTPPEGFSIVSLAEENNLKKIGRVLWRGFNHPGDPPAEDTADRMKMQSGPTFRKDLTIAVKAPNGDFVSFCGMWYDPSTDYALVEPVATHPDYRRLGLGRSAVLEGIRRCAREGAKVAYVGSGQPFYLSIGFRPIFTEHWWKWTSDSSG